MKTISKIITGAFLVLCIAKSTEAQFLPVDEDTKKVTYQEVITREGGTANQLYNQAIEWVNSFYENPANVTRVRDPINGKIEIKHRIRCSKLDKNGNKTVEGETVEYEMTLEFKEGKYRYTITNFNVLKASHFPVERWLDHNDPQYTADCDIYCQQLNEEVNKVIKSLKDGMKPKVIKDDNW